MIQFQYELPFEGQPLPDQNKIIELKLLEIEESYGKVRRRLFHEISMKNDKIKELEKRLNHLELLFRAKEDGRRRGIFDSHESPRDLFAFCEA